MGNSDVRRLAQSRALIEAGRLAGAATRIEDALEIVCRTAAELLDVERVTVWRFVADESAIECVAKVERRPGGPTVGALLPRSDYPSYFAALMSERWIAAHHARSDSRTTELTDDYMVPLDIYAMLDAPVRVAGKTVGIVCHEQARHERIWEPDEQAFAASIADLVALCLEGERSRAVEQAHSQTSQLLELSMEAARLGAWSWDLPTDQIEWSPGVAPIYGKPEGWSPSGLSEHLGLMDERDAAAVEDTIRRTLASQLDAFHVGHRVPLASGETRFIEAWGRVSYDDEGRAQRIVGVVSDLTDRRELEAELIQAQKMDGMGRLAGGVAHDLNNLLLVMKGNVELITPVLSGHRQSLQDMQEVGEAIERASDLVRQLLTFARREPVAAAVFPVEELIEGVERLLGRVLGDDVHLHSVVEPGLHIEIDARRFEQVLMNLAVNARDAMPAGGHLTIEARRLESPEGEAEVAISVRDEGVGLSTPAQERAFEPFFTTKPEGQGTGLGLSICYGIVTRAGGRIGLRAVQPKGTEVWMRFPLADGVPAKTEVRGANDDAELLSAKRPALILVVEDESAVRRLMLRVLSGAGYRTLDACSPDDALSLLAASDEMPDLILSDLVMPGIPVREFHDEVVRIAPEVRFIWMSGYSDDWLEGRLEDLSVTRVLSKPFEIRTVLETVGAVLADPN